MSTDYTNGNGEPSAAEIEREVERTRARLMNTAEELKERISPGQVADQAVEWLRGTGGREFVGNLGASVRDNPLPILLIGAGIAWMAFGGRSVSRASDRYGIASQDDLSDTRRPYGSAYGSSSMGGAYAGSRSYGGSASSGPGIGERIGETASDLKDRAADLASRAGETASDLAARAGETASDLKDRAAELASQAGETASEAWERAKSKAQSLAGSVTDRARGMTGGASGYGSSRYASEYDEYGYQARRSVEELFQSQPLLVGAVGLAVGAALGALLPSTEAENRLMGEQRDRVAGQLQSLAGEVVGQAREQLSDVYERGKEKLNESGLSPSRGAQVVGEVAREIREAVERTAEEVSSTARSKLDRPGGPA